MSNHRKAPILAAPPALSGRPGLTPSGDVLFFPRLPVGLSRYLLLDYPAVMYPLPRAPLWFRGPVRPVAVLVTPPLSPMGGTPC